MRNIPVWSYLVTLWAFGAVSANPGRGIPATALACTPPPPGMVAWWPGDGNAIDIVGGHDGTLFNGATYAAGMVGQGFSFDGVDDVVSIPDAPALRFGPDHAVTIDMWVYPTGESGVQHFVGKRHACNDSGLSYQLSLNTDDGEGVGFGGDYGGTNNGGTDLPRNQWTHLAGSFDGAFFRLYINGAFISSAPAPGLGPDIADDLLIGGSGTCRHFQGVADEIEIFNRALDESEIAAIFNAGPAGKCRPADSDGDDIIDAQDNCPTVPNANQSDADLDGVGDACDNCVSVANATQVNADGDAFGAACDCDDANASVYPGASQICDGVNDDCSDPSWPAVPANEADPDADQIPSCNDNCPLTSNPSQQDSAGSSCGDACDPSPVTVRFTPRTLNKRSQGNYVKLHLALGPNHTAAIIDPGQAILLSVAGGLPIADVGRQIAGNEIDVSFPRQDVAADAPIGESVEFRVTGFLTYGCGFEGVDHVRVIQEGKVHTQESDPSSILDDGTRGNVRTLGQSGSSDMGPSVCLPDYQSNYAFSMNTDPETPPPGECYIYLFKFCNGTPSCSLGQNSAGEQRTVSSGGCP